MNESLLAQEAKLFFSQLNPHLQLPAQMLEQYIKIHQERKDLFNATPVEQKTLTKIVEKKLDAVAIEPWLRQSPYRHLLTRKLLVLSYLEELNSPSTKVELSIYRAFLTLPASLIKGLLLKHIYGLR